VPEAQLAQAKTSSESKLALDGTGSTAEARPDGVCAVHEEPAVATCERCGAFLCAQCGSLGTPPLCEDCVERPSPPVEGNARAKYLARGYLLLDAVGTGMLVLLTPGLMLARLP